MTDFDALLTTLALHHVKFIVVGGAAAIAHGSARLTQDLDIVYERSPENLNGLGWLPRWLITSLTFAVLRRACRFAGKQRHWHTA